MGRKKPSTESSNASAIEADLQKFAIRANVVAKVLQSLVQWLSAIAIAWLAIYAPVRELAGKSTRADLSASVSWPSGPDWWVVIAALAFGVAGILYGRLQSKLRKDTVERLHRFQLQHEQARDPNRTSSGITVRGETNPRDK